MFSYQCSLLSFQATALKDYHISYRLSTTFLFSCSSLSDFSKSASSDSLFTLSHLSATCQQLFSSYFSVLRPCISLRTFHYPARAVRYPVFCIGCLSDEDYLTTVALNCQRFSCFLFISHNSDNSSLLFILYTKYFFLFSSTINLFYSETVTGYK